MNEYFMLAGRTKGPQSYTVTMKRKMSLQRHSWALFMDLQWQWLQLNKKNTSSSRITKMKISIWSTSLPQNEGDNLGYIGSPHWLPLTRLRRPRWKGATREVPPLLRIGPKMDFMGFPQNFPYPNWSFWAYFYADDMIEGNLHQRIKLFKKKKKKGRKDSDASALGKKRADGAAAAARVQRAANAPFDQAVYSVRLAPLALWVSTYQSRWRTQIMSSSARRLRLICLFSSFFFLFFFFFVQASLFISKLVECCGAEEEAENCSSPKSSDAVFFFFFLFFFYHNWQLGSTHCEEERRQIHGLDGEPNIEIQTQRFQGIGQK